MGFRVPVWAPYVTPTLLEPSASISCKALTYGSMYLNSKDSGLAGFPYRHFKANMSACVYDPKAHAA